MIVAATIHFYGHHMWPDAPEHRSYLRVRHPHNFSITGYVTVTSPDRQVEYHDLKDRLTGAVQHIDCDGEFGSRSCEHIGIELLNIMTDLSHVKVGEDEDHFSIVIRAPNAVMECIDEGEIKKAKAGRPRNNYENPRVVTVCGSTRFKEHTLAAIRELEEQGVAVFSVGSFMHADGISYDERMKVKLDELHKKKISMSDYIYVINVNGYIGQSTSSEIKYAESIGIPVIYKFPIDKPRAIVRWFSLQMEEKLQRNEYKGGWDGYLMSELMNMAHAEMLELQDAIDGKDGNPVKEAADVANIMMMIADKAIQGGQRDDRA
jgi:hypothetical protein